jgi:hypothetical protein
MSTQDNGYSRASEEFAVRLICPACSQIGAAVWEESGSHDRSRGARRRLILTSGGFYPGTEMGSSGDPRIICENCETVLPD